MSAFEQVRKIYNRVIAELTAIAWPTVQVDVNSASNKQGTCSEGENASVSQRNRVLLSWYDQLVEPSVKTIAVSRKTTVHEARIAREYTTLELSIPSTSPELYGFIRKQKRSLKLPRVRNTDQRSTDPNMERIRQIAAQMATAPKPSTSRSPERTARFENWKNLSVDRVGKLEQLVNRQPAQPSISLPRSMDGTYIGVPPPEATELSNGLFCTDSLESSRIDFRSENSADSTR